MSFLDLDVALRQGAEAPAPTLYGRYRVREYWIVDPAERTIEVHGLTQTGLELQGSFTGGERVESTLLPYLELTADSIFPLTSRRSEGTP